MRFAAFAIAPDGYVVCLQATVTRTLASLGSRAPLHIEPEIG